MTKQDLMDIIVKVAPGSPLREGVDYILDAGIGALIIIGYDDEVEKVRDGGFLIDCDYTPERIFELSKMDGAIILMMTVQKSCMPMFMYNLIIHILQQKVEQDIELLREQQSI